VQRHDLICPHPNIIVQVLKKKGQPHARVSVIRHHGVDIISFKIERIMKTLKIICALFVFGVVAISCTQEERAQENDMKYVEEEKATLREELRDVRMKIDARLTELGQEMEEAGEEAKVEIQKEMQKLEAEGRKFDAKLDEIGRVTEETWEEFKMGVRKTIDDIKRELESS
jgi:hypothetical protein